MNNHKISIACLYAGVLMALIAADWYWYAGKYPEESFVLQLPFLSIIYVVYLVIMVLCFAAAGIFSWKDRPKHTGHPKKGSRKGEGK